MTFKHSITDILGTDGPFHKIIPSFQARKQQQEMSQSISDAIDDKDVLIAEAGTGTGKTFAYLVPAVLSDKKIIISTGTKNLQDQLYYKDLPIVVKALAAPITTALLKGRANYICLHRLQRQEKEGISKPKLADKIASIRSWVAHSRSGDIAEYQELPENAPIWASLTSTTDNCLYADCTQYDDCYVVKARKQAQLADLVVVNHHLLFADIALRDEGFGQLLPNAEAIIIDEAHQAREAAVQYFGDALTGKQLKELAEDTIKEVLQEAPDLTTQNQLSDALIKSVSDLRLSFGLENNKAVWDSEQNDDAIFDALENVEQHLQNLQSFLRTAAVRGTGLDNCWKRALLLEGKLMQFRKVLRSDGETFSASDTMQQAEQEAQDAQLGQLSGEQKGKQSGVDEVYWYETSDRNLILHRTPISISESFNAFMQQSKSAWIFTSATIAVANKFEYFSQRLGIEEAKTLKWDSPFNYQDQTLLYIPDNMPLPSDSQYTQQVIDRILPILELSNGRAFVLVTSYKALQTIAQALQQRLANPILVQGSQPKTEMLERFRKMGNAILVGTYSFWEGVDVKGEALSCVIIDKLPFASPSDPLMQATIDTMKKHGQNAFFDYQIPQAVISLRQGVGRLIRDENDCGLLMICDPRLFSKSYGRHFLRSLPKIPTTQDFSKVQQFFEDKNISSEKVEQL